VSCPRGLAKNKFNHYKISVPTTQFIAARALLSHAQVVELDAQLNAWKSQGPSSFAAQTASNIENETALEPSAFAKLLADFIDYLPDADAWSKACRKNQFAGALVPAKLIPAAMGRLIEFEKLFDLLEGASVYSQSQFHQLLAEADGKDLVDLDLALLDALHTMPLGKYLIWSTFNHVDTYSYPFDTFDQNAVDCCTRLGLRDPKGATCILLAYHTAAYTQRGSGLTLHRPTVADAGGFELYRPHPDPDQFHGMTHPTPPNPKNLSGCPEITHKSIIGHGLAFKIRVAI
jgi:hypothetical protein